jgi:hypothetical protein
MIAPKHELSILGEAFLFERGERASIIFVFEKRASVAN